MKIFLQISILICLSVLSKGAAEKVYEADYVVVGMGAAGAEIAKLLSDDRKTSVIGIEAGANLYHQEPIKNSTFAPILESNFDPQYFWELNQVFQTTIMNGSFNYTTGRQFGGGTAINGEQYVEGTQQLYQKWEDLLGKFWSYKKILNAFIDIEDYHGLTPFPKERGFKGLLSVRQAPVQPTSMAEKFVAAVTAATGLPEIEDYNVPQTEMGPFTRWQLTQKLNGNRETSTQAFIIPFVNKKFIGTNKRKLQILPEATALRVLFDGKKAIGVAILKDGKFQKVFARKKVILSMGIYSNWLLQVSGIGPKEVLKKAHVDVLVDSPNVGQNLVNQFISVAVFTANPNDVGVPANDPNALYVGGAFLPGQGSPVIPTGIRGYEFIGTSPGPGSFAIAIINVEPQSRGTVEIQSGDPLRIPLVDDMAFTNPADIQQFVFAYQVYIQNIAAALSAIDPLYQLVSPPLDVINDTAALEQFITSTINHTHHWTGTCQMGTSIKNGVVDKHGNVFGVKNLIVADASIAPFIPDGNTQACAFMVGRIIGERLNKKK